MRRILLALGLILLLLLAVLVGLLLTLDVNRYKPQIAAAVRAATHRELSIAGNIALKPSLLPTLAINGLRLGNADWASTDTMLEVKHFEARIALLPLLSRRVEISHIEIDGARLVLETDAEGRGNWQMGAASTAPTTSTTTLPELDVRSLVVRDVILDYRPFAKPAQSLGIKQWQVRADGTHTPLAVELLLEHRQRTLAVKGHIAPLAQWLAATNCPFELSLESGDLKVLLKGEVAEILRKPTVKMNFDLAAPSLAAVNSMADTQLPAVTPLSAQGDLNYAADVLTLNSSVQVGQLKLRVAGEVRNLTSQPAMDLKLVVDAAALTPVGELLHMPLPAPLSTLGPVHVEASLLGTLDALNVDQLQARIAHSDIAGSLRVTRTEGRPSIDANLRSSNLDLSPFDPPPSKAGPKATRLLSSTPFDLGALKPLDARFTLAAERVLSHGLSLDKLRLKGTLHSGTLSLAPYSAGLGGGTIAGNLVLRSAGGSAHLDSQTRVRKLPLSPWFDGSKGLSAPAGVADLDIKLSGEGKSLAALMGSADGRILLDARNLDMSGKAAGMASADLVMSALSLLNPLSRQRERTHIECVVVNFPIVAGRMQNKTGIGISTDQLRILGGGSIDLKTERLDIGVDPKPRAGVGLNVAGIADFVRIGGTLAAPTPVTDARGAASAGVKVGAAIASGGLSLLAEGLLDRNAADVDVCAVARGAKNISGGADSAAATSAQQSQPTSTAGKVVQGAGNAVKGAGNAVKGAFKSLFGR